LLLTCVCSKLLEHVMYYHIYLTHGLLCEQQHEFQILWNSAYNNSLWNCWKYECWKTNWCYSFRLSFAKAFDTLLSFIYVLRTCKSFLNCLILSPLSKPSNSLVILIIVIIVSREWPNSTRCLSQFKSHVIMPTYSLATYNLYQTETKKILKSQRPAEDSTLLPATQWAVLHCIAVMFLVFQHTLKVDAWRNYRTG